MECQGCNTEPGMDQVRKQNVNQAKFLAAATIAWNLFEGVVALGAGYMSGSVALIGFGLDSTIETLSAGIVGFRFWSESRGASDAKNEALERRSARFIGILLLMLACYVVFEAARRLLGFGTEAKESLLGIILTAAALVVMPLLARAKYSSAKVLNSKAMKAEAFQSLTCAWMAGATLLGLALNALFHWTWADPLAAMLFVPAIVKEGMEALKGELCADCH
jgi:divalent metal cation (Fe/Co/Zn/Cd) transporter